MRNKRGELVWHIYRFEERYELADDSRACRPSPLKFIRDFVGSGQDDESISHHQQLEYLRAQSNGLMLIGAFDELRKISGNRSRCYRGYLLDEKLAPAGEEKIASWLRLDKRLTRAALRRLAASGLIERVALPVWDTSKNDDPLDKRGRKKVDTKARNASKRGKRGHPRTNARGGPGAPRRATARAGSSIQERQVGKSESQSNLNGEKTAIGTEEHKDGAALKASPRPAEKKGKAEARQRITAQIAAMRQAEMAERTASSPAAAPPNLPNMPRVSDASRDGLRKTAGHPGGSVTRGLQPLATILPEVMARYSPRAQAFAGRIYACMGVPYDPESRQGHREMGNLASAWISAEMAGLSPGQLNELCDGAVKSAEKVYRMRSAGKRFRKSAEAVWRYEFTARRDALAAVVSRPSRRENSQGRSDSTSASSSAAATTAAPTARRAIRDDAACPGRDAVAQVVTSVADVKSCQAGG